MSYDVSNVGEQILTTSGADLSQMFTHDRLGKLSNIINHINKSTGAGKGWLDGKKETSPSEVTDRSDRKV